LRRVSDGTTGKIILRILMGILILLKANEAGVFVGTNLKLTAI